MKAKPELEQSVQEEQIRAALDQHWAASDADDFETEHRIYHEDAVLEYPQSDERTRGRHNSSRLAIISSASWCRPCPMLHESIGGGAVPAFCGQLLVSRVIGKVRTRS
jgi:hypothetical protein